MGPVTGEGPLELLQKITLFPLNLPSTITVRGDGFKLGRLGGVSVQRRIHPQRVPFCSSFFSTFLFHPFVVFPSRHLSVLVRQELFLKRC